MASFLFTMRIVGFINDLARAPFYTNVPKIYSLAAKKDFKTLRLNLLNIFSLDYWSCWADSVSFSVWQLGPCLNRISTRFVPLSILLIIIVTELLDVHSSYHASIYTSTNHIPFLLPALISGGLIIGVGFMSCQFMELLDWF